MCLVGQYPSQRTPPVIMSCKHHALFTMQVPCNHPPASTMRSPFNRHATTTMWSTPCQQLALTSERHHASSFFRNHEGIARSSSLPAPFNRPVSTMPAPRVRHHLSTLLSKMHSSNEEHRVSTMQSIYT